LTYPSEKYIKMMDFVSWEYYSQHMESHKTCSKPPTSLHFLSWRSLKNAQDFTLENCGKNGQDFHSTCLSTVTTHRIGGTQRLVPTRALQAQAQAHRVTRSWTGRPFWWKGQKHLQDGAPVR
jgi:hypothetical protein